MKERSVALPTIEGVTGEDCFRLSTTQVLDYIKPFISPMVKRVP